MIVLDTNVVSELMRAAPSPTVLAWIRVQDPRAVLTTAITVAEVRYGIERLPDGARRRALSDAAAEVFARFGDQVLPFDLRAAEHYGTLIAARDAAGLPIEGFDAQIAAVCLADRCSLATRNGRDFAGTGVDIVDPWAG